MPSFSQLHRLTANTRSDEYKEFSYSWFKIKQIETGLNQLINTCDCNGGLPKLFCGTDFHFLRLHHINTNIDRVTASTALPTAMPTMAAFEKSFEVPFEIAITTKHVEFILD